MQEANPFRPWPPRQGLSMQVESNGISFNCRIEGRDGAPWVVLSHGLATDLTMWDELTAALSPRYRVVRYDARGHGGTPAVPGDYSLDMLVADVVGLMDALQIERAHFCGLSMGGMIGQGLTLDYPQRVISASICELPPHHDTRIYQHLVQPRCRGAQRRHRGDRGVDRGALVERRPLEAQSGGDRAHAAHDPRHLG